MIDLTSYSRLTYINKGRDRRSGVDCWGLVRLFYAEQFDIDLPSYTDRYTDSHARSETSRLAIEERARDWIEVECPEFGDVVVINMCSRPFHVGVVVDSERFIHALNEEVNTVIERLASPMWARRIEGFYRHAKRV